MVSHSLGGGMRLYVYIALVILKGSHRRMFLFMYMLINVNDVYMMILDVDDTI